MVQNRDKFAQESIKAATAEQNKQLALLQAGYRIESDQEKAKADEAYRIEQERVRKTYEAERAAAEMTRLHLFLAILRQQWYALGERLRGASRGPRKRRFAIGYASKDGRKHAANSG